MDFQQGGAVGLLYKLNSVNGHLPWLRSGQVEVTVIDDEEFLLVG